MKSNLLLWTLVVFIFGACPSPILSAAAAKTESMENLRNSESAAPAKMSAKQERKAQRWAKRFDRLEKKLQKKMDRLNRKGKTVNRLNLGAFLGLIVLLVGGLFIVLGLVIPTVGIVFLIIGIIIAFVGLLIWLLLSGISVDVS